MALSAYGVYSNNLCDGHRVSGKPGAVATEEIQTCGIPQEQCSGAHCFRAVGYSARGAEFLLFCNNHDCINIQQVLNRLFKR